MVEKGHPGSFVDEVTTEGYRQTISLRTYRPSNGWDLDMYQLPVALYFHAGCFTQGTLDDGDAVPLAASAQTPAWVVSVGYSLALSNPFPAAVEDGYLALRWAYHHAQFYGADERRIAVAGHDASGNLATRLAAIVRYRGEFILSAQARLAPLLVPSMTRFAAHEVLGTDSDIKACASCYLAYLPRATLRMHPYVAPLESHRLFGLPPALIASAAHDRLHREAELYASQLIGAGISTDVSRHGNGSHADLADLPGAMADLVTFLKKRLIHKIPYKGDRC
jgi:acetyl esterase